MKLLSLFLLATLSLASGKSLNVITQFQAGPIRYAVFAGSVDDDDVQREIGAMLRTDEVRLGRLVFFSSKRSAVIQSRERYFEGCGADEALVFLKSNGFVVRPGECLEMTEALKIGPNIVVRRIGSGCHVTTKVVAGAANPLEVHSNGTEHAILALSLLAGSNGTPFVEVFVRTDSMPNTDLARSILEQIRKADATAQIGVFVRNDANFTSHCSFPLPLLVQTGALAETRRTSGAFAGAEAVCVALAPRPVRCWDYARPDSPVRKRKSRPGSAAESPSR